MVFFSSSLLFTKSFFRITYLQMEECDQKNIHLRYAWFNIVPIKLKTKSSSHNLQATWQDIVIPSEEKIYLEAGKRNFVKGEVTKNLNIYGRFLWRNVFPKSI